MLWAVVNNAATLVFADAVFQTSQLVRNQIDVNLYGVWSVSKTFVPHLVASRGRLVNIVSFCAECPLPTLALYSATKAGVLCLSEAMRMELTKFGVDVILFNPGIAQDTQIFAGQKENFQVLYSNPHCTVLGLSMYVILLRSILNNSPIVGNIFANNR